MCLYLDLEFVVPVIIADRSALISVVAAVNYLLVGNGWTIWNAFDPLGIISYADVIGSYFYFAFLYDS